MQIEVRLFGPYREAVGEKSVRRELQAGATVADLFRDLDSDTPDLAILTDDDAISNSVMVTKNGKHVSLFDGAETELSDGDVVRAAPPVHGG